ncbi:MAG: class I SAM-dependent methyltransferase [Planctomycetaceae bacterium]
MRNGDVYRAIDNAAFDEWTFVSSRRFFQEAMNAQHIIRTNLVIGPESNSTKHGYVATLQHERLPLITWPWEWCFSMLRDAALLHLELMESSLKAGCILKDASAYNFQFSGAHPIFIDTPSLVRLNPGTPWEGYRQFCQLFLYPLMMQAWKGIHFQPWLRGRVDGIMPEQFAKILSWFDLFRRGALTHVWLHARLQSVAESRVPVASSLQTQGFGPQMILNNVTGLNRVIGGLKWSEAKSVWSDYDNVEGPVSRDGLDKEHFVENVCASRQWKTVWDLGCNQGRYSRIAAKHSDLVVAMDSDHLTIDRFYQALRAEKNRVIVPLVMDLSDPSPGLGWRGLERLPLERRSSPDLVFCLALIHHLVIGQNLLLGDVLRWLASLKATIIIEFVDRDDEQVQRLLRNRADIFSDYNRDEFIRLVESLFLVQRQLDLPSSTRTLYLLHPLSS